jgi:two-component system LytT family response regulator
VTGKAHNVKDGVKLIKKIKPELVFLDVEMPNGTGFRLPLFPSYTSGKE